MKTEPLKNRQKIFTILLAAFLALVLLFQLVSFQVRLTQVCIVTTFGKPTRSILEPGLYWKWPYPFQDYFAFDSRIQVFTGKLEQTYTKDDKNVIIETYVGWRIENPIKFLSRAGTYKNAQKSLEALIRNYSNGVLALYNFSDLVSEQAKSIRIGEIESRVMKLLNEGFVFGEDPKDGKMEGVRESLGIVVEIFGVKHLELPESTTKEVFARMKEERNRIVQSYQSQGEGEAKKIRSEADAMKEKMIIEANAQATIIRGEGDALAASHYKKFEQNRNLAIWLRKLDSLQKLLAQNKKMTLVLDTRTAPFDLLQGKSLLSAEPEKGEPPLIIVPEKKDQEKKEGETQREAPEKKEIEKKDAPLPTENEPAKEIKSTPSAEKEKSPAAIQDTPKPEITPQPDEKKTEETSPQPEEKTKEEIPAKVEEKPKAPAEEKPVDSKPAEPEKKGV